MPFNNSIQLKTVNIEPKPIETHLFFQRKKALSLSNSSLVGKPLVTPFFQGGEAVRQIGNIENGDLLVAKETIFANSIIMYLEKINSY